MIKCFRLVLDTNNEIFLLLQRGLNIERTSEEIWCPFLLPLINYLHLYINRKNVKIIVNFCYGGVFVENKKKSIVTIALVMVLLVSIGFLGYFTGKEISKSGNNKSETAAVSKTENANNDSSSNDSNVQEAADLSGADEQADVNTEKVAEGGSTEQVTSQTENEAGTEAADNSEAAEEIAEKSESATENAAEKVAAANDGKGNTDKDSGKRILIKRIQIRRMVRVQKALV